ncbi:ABC transporter ATP-binding protein [Candidatus Beckwithbacteria bacterium]|nr:ABC transporter ATP-binding protein [Candidatus Beckwithbacteria bacterium]
MSYFTKVIKLASPYWKNVLAISVVILLIAGLKQIEPIVLKNITDGLVGLGSGSTIFPKRLIYFLLAYLLVKVLGVIFNRISWYLSSIFVQKFRSHLKEKGFEHLMVLPLSFFNENQSGKLMSQLDRGTNQLTQIISNSGMYFVPNFFSAIISFVIVASFNWILALFMLVIFILVSCLHYLRFNNIKVIEDKIYKIYDNQYGHFWETITSIPLVKSYVAEKFEQKKLKDFNQQILTHVYQSQGIENRFIFADLLLEFSIWIVYAWVVYLTFSGQFTIGTMVMILGYVSLIREPLWSLEWIFWEVKRAMIGAKDYFNILDAKSNIKSAKNPVKLEEVKGRIIYENVGFSYKRGRAIFEKINFTIAPGTMCALVGKSGVGKTTIINLLNRFYDVSSGKILIDGVNIKNFDLKDLRNSIGLVSQEPYLFAATIEENLRYANPKATLDDMRMACEIANAHEFIKDLPRGYKSEIGEKGVRLSGGQKQRLSLARVILKDPPILILDEATSQLDSHSEVLIQQSLAKVIQGRTTIVIAHRLSTIRKATQILVFDKGKIIEKGSHDELLAKDGLYASLFKIQSGNKEYLKNWDIVGE